MTSVLARVRTFLRAALRGLRATPVTSAVSTATIALALVPVGGLWIVTGNMSDLLERFGSELRLTVFLAPDLEPDSARELAVRIGSLPEVERVELVSREEALERFRARLHGSGLLEALDENPLPASLEIGLHPAYRSPEGMARMEDVLRAEPGVEDLVGGESWVEGYARALRLVRGAGLGLGIVLSVATLLIVSNTIRLAVYARRDELDILALVGASRAFRRTPFLLEGLFQGAAGGGIGLVLLYALFRLAVPQLGDALELFLGWSEPSFLDPRAMLTLVGAGAAFGLTGAAVAVSSVRAT